MRKSLLIVLTIAFIFITACGEQTTVYSTPAPSSPVPKESPQPAPPPRTAPQEVPETEIPGPEQAAPSREAGTEAVMEISMVAKRFSFEPSTITVKKGTKVKITVSAADVPHGIAIPGYGINAPINPGTPTVVEFVADRAGTFEFYCSVYCGSGHGTMKGSLIVT